MSGRSAILMALAGATLAPATLAQPTGEDCDATVFAVELDAGVQGPRLWTPLGVPVVGRPFSLQLVGGPPLGLARLVLGRRVGEVVLPELGASWFAAPPLASVPVLLDGDGASLELMTDAFGPSACGLELVAQAAVGDGTGATQVSNALRLRAGHPTPVVFPGTVIPTDGEPRDAATGDFDGDGHLDLALPVGSDVVVLLGDGTGHFRPGDTISVSSSGARSIVAAELTGDGVLDLAVPRHSFLGRVTVLAGAGDGTFSVGVDFEVGGNPESIVAADFDGDGRADLATANTWSNNVTITLADGLGGFGLGFFSATAADPVSLAAGDFNDDGLLDLAAASRDESLVSLHLGNGWGQFTRVDVPAEVSRPTGIASGDLDGDGLDDLVLTSTFNEVAVLLGNGDATFTKSQAKSSPIDPRAPVLVDLDGDGALDVAFTHHDGNALQNHSVTVFLGNGDGTLGPALDHDGREDGYAVVAGDWNEDGRLDVAVPNRYEEVELFLGLGDGTFAPDPPNLTGGGYPSVADLNGDGLPDLATRESNGLRAYLGNGDGQFTQTHYEPLGDGPGAGVVGDWNEDGIPDAAASSLFVDGVSAAPGNGDGTFGDAVDFPTDLGAWTLVAADLDGNGDPELIVANKYVDSLSVLLARPGLDFDPAVHYPSVEYEFSGAPPRPIAGDVDGDGAVDILAGDGADEMLLLLGGGDGTLLATPGPQTDAHVTPTALGDVDLDGDLDLVAVGDDALHVLEAAGDGSFDTAHLAGVGSEASDATVGDVDRDGVRDLVSASRGRVLVHRGLGDFAFDHPMAHSPGGWNGWASAVTLADVDLDGNLDAIASTLSVFLNLSGEPLVLK